MTSCTAILLSMVFSSFSYASTQTTARTPLDDAKAVLAQFIEFNKQGALQSKESRELVTGEALLWEIPSFGKLAEQPDSFVLLDPKHAVGRVQWFGENDFIADLYFNLRFEGKWKIYAMRRLALTGIVEDVYLFLKEKKNRTPEEEFQFRNSELVLATDSKLRTWFDQNRAPLEKLLVLAGTLPKAHVVVVDAEHTRFPDVERLLRSLNLTVIESQENGNIEIIIGGITDNSVGFIFSPSNRPPSIDPSEYIWVEKLVDKWFLFRTT